MTLKKNCLICMVLMITLLFPCLANADQSVKVKYNDQIVNFEVQPMIDNGRIYVPMRAIFEMLGSKVEWDNKTRTALAKDSNGNELKLRLESAAKAKLMTKSSFLDIEIKNVNGRVLVPLRLISENSGCRVEWSAPVRTVYIENKKQDEHDISSLYLEYTDPDNRFSFNFPAMYDIINDMPNVDLAIIAPVEQQNNETYEPSMLIKTFEVNDIVDFEKLCKETMGHVLKIDPKAELISQKEIAISGNKAVKLNTKLSQNNIKTNSQIIYTQKGKTVYEIVVSLPSYTKQDTRDKFASILSTFKIN